MYDVSQLPVVDAGRIVGILDESDMLLAVGTKGEQFHDLVGQHMVTRLEKVAPGDPIESLLPLFRADKVAIVVDDDQFLGLITKVDLINYTRRAAESGLGTEPA